MWILIAVLVAGVVLLGALAVRLLGRLSGLRRAVTRLQRRQRDAQRLRTGAEQLQNTLVELERRATETQHRLAIIKAGQDDESGKHSLLKAR
nr:hypothetical protein [Mangrovihabitans endophyticus]